MICSLKEKGKDIQVCFMKEERIFYFERNASGEYLFRIFNFKRSCFEEYDSGFKAIFNYKKDAKVRTAPIFREII